MRSSVDILPIGSQSLSRPMRPIVTPPTGWLLRVEPIGSIAVGRMAAFGATPPLAHQNLKVGNPPFSATQPSRREPPFLAPIRTFLGAGQNGSVGSNPVACLRSCEWPPSARNATFGMTAVNRCLPSPFARGEGDLPLLKASKGAILTLKSPGSGECRSRERNPDDPQVIRLRSRVLSGRGVPRRPACRASATPE